MVNLFKYEFRKSLAPFIILMLLNVIWWILNAADIEGNLNKFLQFALSMGNFLIILYSIKAFNDEFDEEVNTLGCQLPVKGVKRFLSKYIMFCAAYSIIVILNIIAALYNKEHILSVMYNQLINSNEYIIYAISSRIIGYISGMMVISFVIMLSKCITEKLGFESIQTVVGLLMFIGIIVILIILTNNDPAFSNNMFNEYSLKLNLKPGLSKIEYEVSTPILFLPGATASGTGSGDWYEFYDMYNNMIPSVSMIPMIINGLITCILAPLVLRLADNK